MDASKSTGRHPAAATMHQKPARSPLPAAPGKKLCRPTRGPGWDSDSSVHGLPGDSGGNGGWALQDFLEFGALVSAVPCARLHARQVLWEWGPLGA